MSQELFDVETARGSLNFHRFLGMRGPALQIGQTLNREAGADADYQGFIQVYYSEIPLLIKSLQEAQDQISND